MPKKKEDQNIWSSWKNGRSTIFLLLAAAAIVAFLILKPYISTLLSALILAYISYPLYKKILKWVKNRNIAASLMIVIILFTIMIPVALIFSSLYQEAATAAGGLKAYYSEIVGEEAIFCGNSDNGLCSLLHKADSAFPDINLKENLIDATVGFAGVIKDLSYKALVSLSTGVVQLFIILFIVFFLMRDGELLIRYIRALFQLKKSEEESLFSTAGDTTYAVIYGTIIVSIIQGALAWLGYYLIADMDNPLLWAIFTGFAAIIPTIGTAIVWVPICIYIIGAGLYSNDYGTIIIGVILAAYCTIVVGLVDNLLRPKIIGGKSGVHPVIIILGILGGVKLFGFIGIVVGPVCLALLITLIDQGIRGQGSKSGKSAAEPETKPRPAKP